MGLQQSVQHFFNQMSHRAANQNGAKPFVHRVKSIASNDVYVLRAQRLEPKELITCIEATD